MEHLWRAGAAMGTAWLSHWGFSLGWRIGELEAALRIVVKEERIWAGGNDRGAKYPLQDSYGKQSLILKDWGRLEEAMALLKKQEALCLELGVRRDLGYCYWQWGPLARKAIASPNVRSSRRRSPSSLN